MAQQSKLGMNALDINHWLSHEPMKGLIESLHQAAVEAGQKVYGPQEMAPDVAAAINAAAYTALMDAVLVSRTLIEYNNDMLAMQLESLGLDLSKLDPSASAPVE